MAHALDSSFPFDGIDYFEDTWRQMSRFWLTSGPVRGELSSFDPSTTAGRNIVFGAGRCWIDGYFGELSTPWTQSFATNTSGNPRIDRVVLRAVFGSQVVIDVLQGTPGASPVTPSLTQNSAIWEEALLSVTLPSTYTSIAATDWLDERRFAQGRPPGGPLAIAAAASTALCSMTNGTWTAITFDDVDEYDSAALHTVPGTTFALPVKGLWTASCTARWGANSTGDRSLRLVLNGTALKEFGPIQPTGSDFAFSQGHYEGVFAPGDHLRWEGIHNITGGGLLNITSARATVRYLGLVN